LRRARLKPTVILFLKAPMIGAVKTRLGKDIGAVAAWRFYNNTVRKVSGALARAPAWRLVLAISPDNAPRRIARSVSLPHAWTVMPQGPGDIGERMQRCLDIWSPAPRVLVGGDIPDISLGIINQSFKNLAKADIVLGPAKDGGFWLIGERGPRTPRRLFDKVNWSSNQTLAQVQGNIPEHMRVGLAEELADIDDGDALAAWQARRSKT